MGKAVRRMITILAALTLVVSIAALARHELDLYRARRTELRAQETAGLLDDAPVPLAPEPQTQPVPEPLPEPVPEQAQALTKIDLSTLRQTNPDVVGWICIPGTQLNYPVVQGTDNQYYLSHTWEGKKNAAGAVFLEATSADDLTGFNTIVYGHNMKNGSIFGSLRQFRKQSHYEEHPEIYVVHDTGVYRYEIFAALEAEVVGMTYRLDLNSNEKRQAFLDYSAGRSQLACDVIPTADDRIITLSTCTGNGYQTRWVVQGVLKSVYPLQTPLEGEAPGSAGSSG